MSEEVNQATEGPKTVASFKDRQRRAALSHLQNEIALAISRYTGTLDLIDNLHQMRSLGGWPKGKPRGRPRKQPQVENGEQPAEG